MRYSYINIRLKGAPEIDVENLEKALVEFFQDQYETSITCTFGLLTCFQCNNHKRCPGGKVVCKLSGLHPLNDPGVQPIEAAQSCKDIALITPLKPVVRKYTKKDLTRPSQGEGSTPLTPSGGE